jgi:MFS family permease
MKDERWLRIIPVALIMYTISYVDRTNISLALDPTRSSMMTDLGMDDRLKGQAAGIFFLGYILLQIPGGYWASRWSARRVVSIFLVAWGVCAVGCGLAQTYGQFVVMRFLLGVAESGVFPATLCCWRAGSHARNGLGRMPSGICASRWQLRLPRRSPPG